MNINYIINRITNFICNYKNEIIVGLVTGFVTGLVTSTLVTIWFTCRQNKKEKEKNEKFKSIILPRFKAILKDNNIDDFIDKIKVAILNKDFYQEILNSINDLKLMAINFVTIKEADNIQTMVYSLEQIVKILDNLSFNQTINKVIIDIYLNNKEKIKNDFGYLFVDEAFIKNYISKNKITKNKEKMYRTVFHFIQYYQIFKDSIIEFYKQTDYIKELKFDICSCTYKTIKRKNKYYCGRCGNVVGANAKECKKCDAKLQLDKK